MNYLKKNFTIIFILVISTIFISIWFKDRNILGTAEDGLIFYNISNYYHQAEYTWMEYPGLGSPSLTLIAGKPTFLLLSFLQSSGIAGFLIQAIVLWGILIVSAVGVYLLVKELFPKLSQKYILISILFYWFNQISLTGVWNRFLLNYIFFFALIPMATYLYIRGLKEKRYTWILLLNIFLFFLSYAFSYIAFIILFWIWLMLLTIYFVLINRSWKLNSFYLKYFFLTVILFGLVNNWWVLPFIKLYLSGGFTPTTNQFVGQDNIGVLDALSSSIGNLTDILKLTNASFLSSDSLGWVKTFVPIESLLLYIIVGTILYTFIKLRKEPLIQFLAYFFFLFIFLAKGTNPPFGEIFRFIFKHISIIQVFRNPFEKFGFLLSLVASLLIGISFFTFNKLFKERFESVLYFVFFAATFFILGFPLYSTLAFTNKVPPTNNYSIGYQVKVPSYYIDVKNYLNNKGNNFRLIGLPIKDEGINYNWEKGYAGVELAVALYDSKGIFHNTSTPFFNQVVPYIEETLLSNNDFSSLANLVNSRYFLVREDLDYKFRKMTDPFLINQNLEDREKKGEVKRVAVFGKISIWENTKWKDSTFYIADKFIKVRSSDQNLAYAKVNVLNREILIDESDSKILDKLNIPKSSSSLEVNYQKINTTKYLLHIKHAVTPFLLNFSELYNDEWKAYYNDGKEVNNHMRVNIFANSWVVDRQGDFDMVVEFSPQYWMDIGEKISAISSIIMLGTVIYILGFRKKRMEV